MILIRTAWDEIVLFCQPKMREFWVVPRIIKI